LGINKFFENGIRKEEVFKVVIVFEENNRKQFKQHQQLSQIPNPGG